MAADPPVPPSLVEALRERYTLARETGRGGSATVYLARDLKHDRAVAIKVLNADVDETSGERFLREIKVSAGMQHPHILPTYDSGIADGRLYFIMPFVDGGSLRERLDSSTAIKLEDALRIAREIAVALAHAHALGVVHRDVKPENIMFYHGTACLADFGIARVIAELDPGLTAHGTFVGTPAYMSPEQYAAVGFDGRSDVYSLACVLYEMIARARYFAGTTFREVIQMRGVPGASRTISPGMPDFVDELLSRGLAQLPEDRFADAPAFIASIDDALRRMGVPQRVSIREWARMSWGRHKLAYGIGAAGVVLLAGFAWPAVRRSVSQATVRLQGDPAPIARTAYDSGQVALTSWNIPAAQQAFAHAVAADSTSAPSRLWLAESHALGRRSDGEEFKAAALRLRGVRHELNGRDSLFAEALVAIATGNPSLACAQYARQLERDTTDVLAWIGLGDCLAINAAVVRDQGSPSGWRFESSYHAAARAYVRAVTLDPKAHAALPFATLAKLLPSNAASIRIGRSIEAASGTFAAYPALIADTIAFVPYPIAMFSATAPSTISPSQPMALEHNREVLLDFAAEWAASSPTSADAWEALSLAREARGELADDGAGAGAAIRSARSRASAPAQQTRLGAAQVRLYMKRGEFRRASSLTDSILGAWRARTVPADVDTTLSGLAALTGRVELTTTFLTASSASEYANVGVAPELNAAAQRFFARAAPGVCDDTLTHLRQEFERVLASYASPNRRDAVRQTVLWQGAPLAFPCLNGAAISGLAPNGPLDRAQRTFAAHDLKRTRIILDSVATVRAGYRPGDISLDHTVQEAWLRLAIGDSAGAESQLDLVLDALPTLGAKAVTEEAQSAAVGRAMVLRADLAAARHDVPTARRWATGALELWSNADASLKPMLNRMQTIIGK